MNQMNDDRFRESLKRAMPPMTDTELKHDLWPRMLRRLDESPARASWLDLALLALLSFLMVSTWRFWSGKEINLSRRFRFQTLLIIAIGLFATIKFSQGVLFAAALMYMFSGIWARAAYSWSRRRRHRPGTTLEPSGPLGHP